MTRTKLELATILVNLRKDGSDPEKLAKEMTLRRLCFEIEKAQENSSRSFWSFLTHDSSDDEE
jgi:hypothetical protein